MSRFREYQEFDALGLATCIRKGEVSPIEVLEAAVEQVEALNPRINAVITPMYDEARKAIDRGLPQGPLRGVPFLLKDLNIYYAGAPTTNGSRFFADYIPDHDSELVARYKKAGLVIFGKTNTPEMGLIMTTEPLIHGPTRNPWNLERTAGGSSGGSAAAVAARMVPAAHASDGGGSIRIPASCCGVFGLKPTRGRVPLGPDVGEGWAGMSAHHVVSRTVRDSAAFLDAVAGPGMGDPYWACPPERPFLEEVGRDPGKLRIGWTISPPSGAPVSEECQNAMGFAVQLCNNCGHRVEETKLPINGEELLGATRTIIMPNTRAVLHARAEALGRELVPTDVERVTWYYAEMGGTYTATQYIRAIQTIHRIGRQMAQFFENCDILLSPVLLKPPVPLGTINMMSEDIEDYFVQRESFCGFTNLFNATGQPSMSVPLYWNDDGLPIGLQFSTRFGEEATLFRLAAQLEQACPWLPRRPPL